MDPDSNRRLSQAIRAGDIDVVRSVLQGNPQIIRVDWGNGSTWLHKAAEFDNPEVVAEFVSAGIDINAKLNNKPQTPLHLAVLKQCGKVVRWLVENGADVDAGGGTYPVPLSFAASGNLEIVEFLVSHGANVNTCHDYPPSNPLFLARKWNKPQIERFLREQGAVFPWEMREALEIHAASTASVAHFKNHLKNLRRFSGGSDGVPVQIWISEATPERASVILCTCGLSGVRMETADGVFPERIEALFELPGNWPASDELLMLESYRWPIDWLDAVCKRVIFDRVFLYEGHTLSEDPPRPLGPQTEMTSLLVLKELRPFGVFSGPDNGRIQVLSLFPIHTAEEEYLVQRGLVVSRP